MPSARTVAPAVFVLLVGGALAWWSRGGQAPATAPVAEHPADGPGAAPPPAGGDQGSGGPRSRPEPVRARVSLRFERVAGRVSRPEPVAVTATVRAPVGELLVREGDVVEKGQILVRLLAAGWERERDEAEKAGDGERKRKAEDALSRLDVTAPEAGSVFRVDTSLGDPSFLGPRAVPLVLLFDWRRLEVACRAPKDLADLAARDTHVVIRFGGVGDQDVAGIVTSSTTREDGSVDFVVVPAAPPPAIPEEDAGVAVLLPVGEREVLVVPRAALRRDNGRDVVDVVPVAGEPEMRVVTPGAAYEDGMVEILEGLGRFESILVPVKR